MHHSRLFCRVRGPVAFLVFVCMSCLWVLVEKSKTCPLTDSGWRVACIFALNLGTQLSGTAYQVYWLSEQRPCMLAVYPCMYKNRHTHTHTHTHTPVYPLISIIHGFRFSFSYRSYVRMWLMSSEFTHNTWFRRKNSTVASPAMGHCDTCPSNKPKTNASARRISDKHRVCS